MATPVPINRVRFSAAEVLRATGGTGEGPSWRSAVGVTTDSRAVQAGNLFVALSGERFDGHAFVPRAVEAGAAAVVVQRSQDDSVSSVCVPDTLVALGDLACAHRQRWGGTVVGVTGSAGKTTTKEMIAAALRGVGQAVHRTSGNLNNHIGVPMTLFELSDAHDVAVIEMGASEPGDIAQLAEIARPDVGVLTLVAAAHTEGLGSVEAVAKEKTSLFSAVPEDGTLVALGDDARIVDAARAAAAKRVVLFGQRGGNDVQLVRQKVTLQGTECEYLVRGERHIARLNLLGSGAAMAGAAALATMVALERDVAAAVPALGDVDAVSGRMKLEHLGEIVFIDDAYNASPASVRLAIDTGSELARAEGRRFVAALGDMKELGDLSDDAHRAVGEHLLQAGARYVIFCGEAMQHAFAVVAAAGVPCEWFDDVSTISPEAVDRIEDGDLLLVKGSRTLEMEKTLELVAQREHAS